MGWRIADETDLAATLSQGEVEAFRQDGAVDGSDPVSRLLTRTTAFVRGFIARNGNVKLGTSGTLPESLISPAMDYAASDVLKRIGVSLNDDRRKAREDALKLFHDVATGAYTPESDGAEESATTGGPAIEVVTEVRPRVTAAKLEGL